MLCIIVSYPVISCYITLYCFNFVCIVMCLLMFTVVFCKGWPTLMGVSLPPYFYECLCIVQFYLANKVSTTTTTIPQVTKAVNPAAFRQPRGYLSTKSPNITLPYSTDGSTMLGHRGRHMNLHRRAVYKPYAAGVRTYGLASPAP